MTKPKYHVVVLADGSELLDFEAKADLEKWLNTEGVRDGKHRDGRHVVVFSRGHILELKTSVSV